MISMKRRVCMEVCAVLGSVMILLSVIYAGVVVYKLYEKVLGSKAPTTSVEGVKLDYSTLPQNIDAPIQDASNETSMIESRLKYHWEYVSQVGMEGDME